MAKHEKEESKNESELDGYLSPDRKLLYVPQNPNNQCTPLHYNSDASTGLAVFTQSQQPSIEKVYFCDQSPFSAVFSFHLRSHMLYHSAEKRFLCDKCAYLTAFSTNFKNHMLMHSEKKTFSCQQCSYSSNYKSPVTAHMTKVHKLL
jgi:hypothetical protein